MNGPTPPAGDHHYEVVSRVERYRGPIFSVVTDEVTMPGGGIGRRDYVRHLGAVGVVPFDERGRVVLVRQYRHPLGRHVWELPAGLMDVDGEDLVETARRELAEETYLTAGRVDLLVDLHTSPGFSDERVRIFLARELSEVPVDSRHERRDEEADMRVVRVDLDEAVSMVLTGEITNALCVAGLLATVRVRDSGWRFPRVTDAPLAN